MSSHRAPRNRAYDGAPYAFLVDPLLSRLHEIVCEQVEQGARVLDVGCGTGSLAFRLARRAAAVHGIELSPDMIAFARRRLRALDGPHLTFELGNAIEALSACPEERFDVATLVMVLHEIPAGERVGVLRASARAARRVICLDYSPRMPLGVSAARNHLVELLAGPGHFRAFRDFSRRGGLAGLCADAGLSSRIVRLLDGETLELREIRR